jgi:cell wall-associated NlpC family hydrolase
MPPEQNSPISFCEFHPLKNFLKSFHIILFSFTVAATQLVLPAAGYSEITPETSFRQSTDEKAAQSCKISGTMQKFFVNVTQYFGTRYRSGGQTPAGFDCSGFVRFMFGKVFNMELPRSSREMAAIGNKISKNDLQPGDLVFFQTKGQHINHVGIFIGNDTFVHSSLSKGITEDQLNHNYYEKRFAGAVRLLDPSSEKGQDFPAHQKHPGSDAEPS